MVIVAQLVRASDCGSECRGFESHLSPLIYKVLFLKRSTLFYAVFKRLHTKYAENQEKDINKQLAFF